MNGQVFVIEALIASSILFLVLFSLLSVSHPPEEYFYTQYVIYKALTSLDANGSLRNITFYNDTKTLEKLLENLAQKRVFVTYFSIDENITPLPKSSREISSISYYISGDFNLTLPREIRVYVIE